MNDMGYVEICKYDWVGSVNCQTIRNEMWKKNYINSVGQRLKNARSQLEIGFN